MTTPTDAPPTWAITEVMHKTAIKAETCERLNPTILLFNQQ